MSHPGDAMAANLRAVREGRGLSLEQVAELTGVSKSMLRQIEVGKSSPTIATIWKIANGLKVSFTALLHRPEIAAEVRAFDGEPPLMAESSHCRLYPLIPFSPQRSFETYYFELDPDTHFHGEPHEGDVTEYLFVLQGALRLVVGGREFEVGERQFLQFPAHQPHEYHCVGPRMAAAIMQVSYLG
ncbi:MAG: helix-turn-helix domain-containing protein [Deferrisomatales bacterium]